MSGLECLLTKFEIKLLGMKNKGIWLHPFFFPPIFGIWKHIVLYVKKTKKKKFLLFSSLVDVRVFLKFFFLISTSGWHSRPISQKLYVFFIAHILEGHLAYIFMMLYFGLYRPFELFNTALMLQQSGSFISPYCLLKCFVTFLIAHSCHGGLNKMCGGTYPGLKL